MTREQAVGWVLFAWLGAVGITTARQLLGKQSPGNLAGWMPDPKVYLGSAVLFTILWGGAMVVPGLAVSVAVGVDVALLASPYLKGQSGLLDQAAKALEKISPPAGSSNK